MVYFVLFVVYFGEFFVVFVVLICVFFSRVYIIEATLNYLDKAYEVEDGYG